MPSFRVSAKHTPEAYFGKPDGRCSYSNHGLNIVSPLLPKVALTSMTRRRLIQELTKSPDPDISEWPSVRGRQKKEYQGNYLPSSRASLSLEVCLAALANVGDAKKLKGPIQQPSSGIDFVESFSTRFQDIFGNESNPLLPIGSPRTARIGIVLDEVWIGSYQEMLTLLPQGINRVWI